MKARSSPVPAEELWAQIEDGRAPLILDVRSRSEYARGRVPGARHLPFWAVSVRASSLAVERHVPVVVYCGHGPRAYMAGAALRRAGFDQVVYLRGHMAGWRRARLPEECD